MTEALIQTSDDHLLGQQAQAVLAASEPPPESVWLALARRFYQAGRFSEGEALTARAVQAHPQAKDLWNVRGVLLRVLRRPQEALAALNEALRLDVAFTPAVINRGNVLLDLGEAQAALDAFTALLNADPEGPEPRALIGRALLRLGRTDDAVARFRQAVTIKPGTPLIWLELAEMLKALGRIEEAEAAYADGLAANPDHPKLVGGMVGLLRTSGRAAQANGLLQTTLARRPNDARAHFHMGDLQKEAAPETAMRHLRRALELDPGDLDILFLLLQLSERYLPGDEGALLDQVYPAAATAAESGGLTAAQSLVLENLFARVCAFAAIHDLEARRDGSGAGRIIISDALLSRIGRATTPQRRRTLMEQHRVWGRGQEAIAAQAPLRTPQAPAQPGKIRLGFLSSDLRAHVVGFFAYPLFEHLDRERFEVFAYAFNSGSADAVQAQIQSQVDGFRWWPTITARAAAEKIAEDRLDILIDLGGHTTMNRPDVLAYRPAPIQASWLGYPHSVGLSTVDYFICDPHNQPTASEHLLEQPLLAPASWVAVSPALLSRYPPLDGSLPSDRKGHITYGTANNPNKYTPDVLAAWARVVAATPGSHFAFLRPEAGSQVFRSNVEAAFAREGVAGDRLDWRPVRGKHLPLYGDVDISLDTFPLTGGTTTVDALMMGVPVVSLAGEAFHERISRSILASARLADLCVDTLDSFHRTALSLADDRDRRLALRRSLRATLQASPLGQSEAFARDFYDLIHRTVMAARAASKA